VFFYLHGGGLTIGGGEVCGAMAASSAENAQARTLGVDYRMPPRHPYPIPLEACVAAYLLERHDPADIFFGGQSAGGNLAAALILRARDEGLPMPVAATLLTPEVDLTESGDSFETLMGIDPVLTARLIDSILLCRRERSGQSLSVAPVAIFRTVPMHLPSVRNACLVRFKHGSLTPGTAVA
jgi:monoterpene epsilon-lactone hydrolase